MAGCSYSYVDEHGTHHTVGLVKIAVPAVGGSEASAGSIVEVTTLGVAAYQTPLSSGFTIGYNHERLMGLKNNVSVADE